MAARDFKISEAFHRNKRTALIFCTAILVTRIPGIDLKSASGIIGVSLEAVSIDLVRLLLFISATYYLVGFAFDFWTEYQVNKGPTDDRDRADLAARCEGYFNAVSPMRKELMEYGEERLNQTYQQTEKALRGLRDLFQRAANLEPEGRVDGRWRSMVERLLVVDLEQFKEALKREDSGIQAELDRVQAHLDRFSALATRISGELSSARRWQFTLWEPAGVAGCWLLAAYFMPYVWTWPLLVFGA